MDCLWLVYNFSAFFCQWIGFDIVKEDVIRVSWFDEELQVTAIFIAVWVNLKHINKLPVPFTVLFWHMNKNGPWSITAMPTSLTLITVVFVYGKAS